MVNDLTNKRFGRLTVLNRVANKGAHAAWLCECDCGGIKTIVTHSLTRGHTKSCGCLNSEMAAARVYTHGMSKTPTYSVWADMRKRCNNPNSKDYKNYGGAGITVCERWYKFENFYADMGEQPEGMSIDRVDNSLGYAPDNCRWATSKQQANNKSNNRRISYNGETKNLGEWAREIGISRSRLSNRLKDWPIGEALTLPKLKPHERSIL